MPRSNREYLLRFADQALGNLDNSLENLKRLSDAYAGVELPMAGSVSVSPELEVDDYTGQYAKYQKYVDLVATQLMAAKDDLLVFRKNFM